MSWCNALWQVGHRTVPSCVLWYDEYFWMPSLVSMKTMHYHWWTRQLYHNVCHDWTETAFAISVLRICRSNIPHTKVHGANMGPIWGRQDPGGPHVGPMNFAIWDLHWSIWSVWSYCQQRTQRGIVFLTAIVFSMKVLCPYVDLSMCESRGFEIGSTEPAFWHIGLLY